MRNQALGANGGGAAAGTTGASARHGRANAITRPVVASRNSRRVVAEPIVSSESVYDGLKSGLGPSASLRTHPAPSRDFSPRPIDGPPRYVTFPIGNFLIRFPVPAKIALQTAGAIGGVPGSPTPPCASVLGTIWTSTTGISARSEEHTSE